MASNIDETFPRDNEQVQKSEMRANFAAAKEEIEALQAKTSLPVQIAFGILSL
jgi:hypothetical protein